jgi:hypothetical protein
MDPTAMRSDAPDDEEPGGDEEQAPASSGPGGGNSEEEAEEQTPLERSDRYTTGTVSREKWIELMNRADPFEQSLRTQKEFDRTEPPGRSIKAYRKETRYYLLNRGERPVERLRYWAYEVDVNVRRVESSQLYEAEGVPPESFFQVGQMELQDQLRMAFALVSAQWEGGHVFEAESDEKGDRLRIFDPTDPTPGISDLSVAPVEPTPIDP